MKTSDFSPKVIMIAVFMPQWPFSQTETTEDTHSLHFNPKDAVGFLD